VQNLEETKGYVLEALLLAVVFIYLILASLFGSFVQPLSIMIALPLSFIGVALALLVTKGTISVMAMIGIIMLMGLVTKNGILLIDFTNHQREQGMSRTEALHFRYDPAGARHRRGRRAACADGARGDRWADHVDVAHSVCRADGVHAAG
jgi:multidrug efflux pump subunit AcrB